jgi:hypothetical protein
MFLFGWGVFLSPPPPLLFICISLYFCFYFLFLSYVVFKFPLPFWPILLSYFLGGAIVFHKDIKPAKLGDQPVGLVTTQAYFNPREKLNPDGSLKAIKEGEEFVVMQVDFPPLFFSFLFFFGFFFNYNYYYWY